MPGTKLSFFLKSQGPDASDTLRADVKCFERRVFLLHVQTEVFLCGQTRLVFVWSSKNEKQSQSLPKPVDSYTFGLDKRRVATNYLFQPNLILLCCRYNSISINHIACQRAGSLWNNPFELLEPNFPQHIPGDMKITVLL